MSKLRKEIAQTNTEIKDAASSKDQLQRISDDLLAQVAGGWTNAYFRWSKSF